MPKKCCKKDAVVLLFNKENEFDVLKFTRIFWEELVRVKPSCQNLVVKSIQLDFASPNLASTLNCGLAKIAKCYNIKNVISTMYSTSQELKVLEIICCKYRNKFKATGTGNALEAYVFMNNERTPLTNNTLYEDQSYGYICTPNMGESEKSVYGYEVAGIGVSQGAVITPCINLNGSEDLYNGGDTDFALKDSKEKAVSLGDNALFYLNLKDIIFEKDEDDETLYKATDPSGISKYAYFQNESILTAGGYRSLDGGLQWIADFEATLGYLYASNL